MTNKPLMTQEEVLHKLNQEWNFEDLLKPYKEGGKPDMPVERTWGTLIDWLINKRKFPADIVGSAIFLVWLRIKKDGHFEHDLKEDGQHVYGSAGRKFAHALSAVCSELMKNRVSGEIFTNMAGNVQDRVRVAFRNDMFELMPWFVKMFSLKYWKHRSQKRKLKKGN